MVDRYTETVKIRVQPELVERLKAALKAKNLRTGGEASISEEGRAALVRLVESLEAEYGAELAALAAFRSVEQVHEMGPADRATAIADGVISDPEHDPRVAELLDRSRNRTRAAMKLKGQGATP